MTKVNPSPKEGTPPCAAAPSLPTRTWESINMQTKLKSTSSNILWEIRLPLPNSSLRPSHQWANSLTSSCELWKTTQTPAPLPALSQAVGFQCQQHPPQTQRRMEMALEEVGSSATQQQRLEYHSDLHSPVLLTFWLAPMWGTKVGYCLAHIQPHNKIR